MTVKDGSAEIYELDNARARWRSPEVDPANFLAVGPYLEAVRVAQLLALSTVSERTHIKTPYLEAIETMSIDELPSKPFAIGFVKVYAEALGLEPGPIVERFKDEAGYGAAHGSDGAGAAPAERHAPARAAAAPAQIDERSNLSLLAVAVIVMFMVWCFFQITHPGADAVRTPLKFNVTPAAATPPAAQAELDPAAAPPAGYRPAAAPSAPEVIEARIVERVEPVYPPICEASAAPQETVEIVFTIAPDGGVVSERVGASSNGCFDRAALNAVKRWRFSPRTIDGAPRPAFEQSATFRFDRPS
ncbi:MAG: TonB family protein [Parvularculaceae bacterium]